MIQAPFASDNTCYGNGVYMLYTWDNMQKEEY